MYNFSIIMVREQTKRKERKWGKAGGRMQRGAESVDYIMENGLCF